MVAAYDAKMMVLSTHDLEVITIVTITAGIVSLAVAMALATALVYGRAAYARTSAR